MCAVVFWLRLWGAVFLRVPRGVFLATDLAALDVLVATTAGLSVVAASMIASASASSVESAVANLVFVAAGLEALVIGLPTLTAGLLAVTTNLLAGVRVGLGVVRLCMVIGTTSEERSLIIYIL